MDNDHSTMDVSVEKSVYAVKLVGIRPLLMSAGRKADPLDPYTKRLAEVTKKRSKTDEDHETVAVREWEAGLYVFGDRVVIPGENLDALLRDGAKVRRQGKAVKAGVEIEEEAVPLVYEGPQDWRKLYEFASPSGTHPFVDRRGVRLGGETVVMRTRPRFPTWSLSFHIARYDFASVGIVDVQRALTHAGVAVGLGDFRPRFGLFRVASFEKVS